MPVHSLQASALAGSKNDLSYFGWRGLRTGELDHEALWLPISIATIAVGSFWARFQLPVPPCLFHQLTGCPCPGCGATRAMRQLAQGHIQAAFHYNPLAVCLFAALALFDLYAGVVLALRLPRFRIDRVATQTARILRVGAAAAVLANWGWLIYAGV